MGAPNIPVISPSTLTHILNFILGFIVSILAVYLRKRMEDADIKKRTMLAIKNEINENKKILEDTTRIFKLKTVVWDNINSYLVRNETKLFLKTSDLYSDINTRNDIMFLYNMSKCLPMCHTTGCHTIP